MKTNRLPRYGLTAALALAALGGGMATGGPAAHATPAPSIAGHAGFTVGNGAPQTAANEFDLDVRVTVMPGPGRGAGAGTTTVARASVVVSGSGSRV